MTFQMEVYCDTHYIDDGYICESGTNPYTGQYMERFIKVDEEDDEEPEDEYAPYHGLSDYERNTDWQSCNNWWR